MDEAKKPDATNPEQTPESTPAPAGEMAALMARLERMEALLEKQAEYGKKTARSRALNTLLTLALVVVFAAGLFALNSTLSTATRELPQLITTTTQSVEQLQLTLQDISQIDFAAMNTAIEGISDGVDKMNFDALNESIEDLNRVVGALGSIFR